MTLGARGTMAVSCVGYLALGVITAALGPALPELAAKTGSSLAGVGALVTSLFLGGLLSQLAVGALIDRLGRRPVLMAGAGLLALGTLAVTAAGTLPLVLLAAFVAGTGHGSLDVSSNILIGEVFTSRRSAALNLLNAFFGFGAVLGPAAASLALRLWHTALPALWLGSALMLLQLVLIPRLAEAPRPIPSPAQAGGQPGFLAALLRSPVFWTLGLLLLIYVGVENGMSSWTTTYLARTTTLELSVGALASAGFWLALSGGRIVGAIMGVRLSPHTMLLITLVGALAAGALLAASGGNALLTVLAVLLTGFFYGPVFPTVVAIATTSFRRATGTAAGLVLAMGSLGGALLPWLQGVLLERAGPEASVVLVALAALAMLAFLGANNLVRPAVTADSPAAI